MKLNEINIKSWYASNFEEDTWGIESIDSNFTFADLWEALNSPNINVCFNDSLIRERCFSELSDLLGVDYDIIYYKWLGEKNENEYVYFSA